MANQHFFKPLLPGFHSHLTIPEAFFFKYIEGRHKQKTAKLRSDASKITWEVKIEDGQKLTHGWKEFALAHGLLIGDILIFRQEKDLDFHVTLLGPSCCEIQYGSCLDDQNNLEKIQRKKNPKREAESSSLDPSCFVVNVAPSTLRYDVLYFPRSFVRANGLDTRIGEIALMNEKGTSWTLALKRKKSCGTMYITRGWRSFCLANGLKAGDIFTFKLIQRGRTLVLRLSTRESEEEEEEESSEGDEIESLSTELESDEESNQNRFVTLTLTPFNVKDCRLFLPIPFTRINGISEETKMALLDKDGVNWSTNLRSECKRIKLVGGWKDFFKANSVKTGESIKLELIWKEDASCVLKFCSKVKPETK